MTRFSWRGDAIADAFRRSATRVEETHHGVWRLELRNGKTVPALATLRDDCLRLSAPATLPRHKTPAWCLMATNASLPPEARFTFDRATGALALLVEVFIDRASMDARVVDQACDTLLRALAVAHAGNRHTDVEPVELSSDDTASGVFAAAWTQDWNDADLPVKSTGKGRWAVDVEIRNGNAHIVIAQTAEGTMCHAKIADAPAGRTPREAMARFLLCASNEVRFVRAATRRDGKNPAGTVRFETVMPAAPSVVAVERGVMALASACDRFGPEARALADEWLADSYCRVRRIADGSIAPWRPGRALVAWKRFLPGGSHAVE